MTRGLATVVLALAAAVRVAQQTPVNDVIAGCFPLTIQGAAPFHPPEFADFPVSGELRRKPARVNLTSHPMARQFRTMIRSGAAEGPNFAGHYTIVSWGCGSGCSQLAIVNAANGRVFFPPEVRVVRTTHVMEPEDAGHYQLNRRRFSRDSALFAVIGAPNEGPDEGVFYYRWSGDSLKLVRFIRSVKTACDPITAVSTPYTDVTSSAITAML